MTAGDKVERAEVEESGQDGYDGWSAKESGEMEGEGAEPQTDVSRLHRQQNGFLTSHTH